MTDDRREETIRYHENFYKSHALYEEGSWLAAADPLVVSFLDNGFDVLNANVLDLGCGVGRNSIFLAKKFKNRGMHIRCIDSLPVAISQLNEYAKKNEVASCIEGSIGYAEEFAIDENKYDLIIAISVLEHCLSLDTMMNTLNAIEKGTKKEGFNILSIGTSHSFTNLDHNSLNDSGVETSISTERMFEILKKLYKNWKLLKLVAKPYKEHIKDPVSGEAIWSCEYVNLVAQKTH